MPHFEVPEAAGRFAVASGADPEQVEKMRATIEAHVPLLAPEQDEAILREVGFSDVALF